MAHIPAWERLPDALTRIIEANGLPENEAQVDICQAIADGSVRIRAKLGRHTRGTTARDMVLEGKDFRLPTALRPEDLDWRESRPLKPWLVPRETFQSHG